MRAELIKNSRVNDARAVRVAGRAPQWIVPAVRVMLVMADAFVAAFCFVAAFYLREGAAVLADGGIVGGRIAWSGRFAPYGALLLFIVLIRLLVMR